MFPGLSFGGPLQGSSSATATSGPVTVGGLTVNRGASPLLIVGLVGALALGAYLVLRTRKG